MAHPSHTRLVQRRQALAALGLLAPGWAGLNAAPVPPVHILVGYSAGGAVDTIARLLAAPLQRALGQPVVVDNRTGLGGNLATKALTESPADGNWLMLATNALAANHSLYKPTPYAMDSIVPVSLVGRVPVALAVPSGSPHANLAAFLKHAKAKPKALHAGSPGNGSTPHLAMELFERAAGIRLRHIAYKGGPPAIADTIEGHVDLLAVNALELLPHVQAGRLRVLAVLSAQRSPVFPNAPTVAESGFPGFEASVWYGLVAPKGLPTPTLDRLHRAVQDALSIPEVRERMRQAGGDTTPGARAAFDTLLATETQRYARLIADAGIRLD